MWNDSVLDAKGIVIIENKRRCYEVSNKFKLGERAVGGPSFDLGP